MPGTLSAASETALAFQAATRTISGRLSAVLAVLWRQLDPWSVQASWDLRLPEAVGAFTAAQQAAAGMADGYVSRAVTAQGRTAEAVAPAGVAGVDEGSPLLVDPAAFAGQAASGLSLETLLSIPAARAQQALIGGMSRDLAMQAGEGSLRLYANTEVADAARDSAATSIVTHRVGGYIRVVGAMCCSRCGILSGRWYRYSAGFERHPGCHCINVPANEVDESEVPSPQELYRQGRITDLTAAEKQAIDMGADLNQVVNAHRGMYVAGGHEYTREGTTRRGVAGARILARDIARAGGAGPGGLYTNFTVSRQALAQATAKYGPMMRRGTPFQRRAPLGGTQQVSGYRRTATARMSPAEILRTSTSREDAVRQMINHGYVLSERDAAGSVTSLERLFRAS